MASPRPVEITVPGDKSLTHRALLFAALAAGESRLSGLLDAADTRSTAAALGALGSPVPSDWSGEVSVAGRGLRGLTAPAETVDCGNSGTTARLLLGALAGCPLEATLTGDASLRRRPMRRVTEPLSACGARFDALGEDGRLPIRVRGARPLSAIDHRNHRSSAQVKTALLLAGLTGGAPVTVTEPRLSRDHSERMLAAMGAGIRRDRDDGGFVTALEPVDSLAPLDFRVPGDFSSAAFFLALGALRGAVRVRGVGLNPTRTGMLEVLRRMGLEVRAVETGTAAGEPVGDVEVGPAALAGTTVASGEIPALLDEVPILAALAATARGETRFEGVAELRVKESDRVHAMVENLGAIGVEAHADDDVLVVRGTDRALSGQVDAFEDHRIAMAFGVLAAVPGHRIEIRGRDAVAISYPRFWNQLERVNMELEAQ